MRRNSREVLAHGRIPCGRGVPGGYLLQVVHDRITFNPLAPGDPVLDALQASLSPERFATYLAAAGGNRPEALRLYTWNTALSAAFYGPLQGLEVAVRNAMHRELSARYGPAWYDNPQAGLDAGALDRISAGKDELRRGHYVVDPPHLVAALPFGFWVSLLGRGGRNPMPGGTPKRDYDMTLWRPALHRAFSSARLRRADAHSRLDYLRTFRNRIADHDSILLVTGWISAETRDWIAHHSRVPGLLGMTRSAAAVSF